MSARSEQLMAGVAAWSLWARQVRQHRRARGRASGAGERAWRRCRAAHLDGAGARPPAARRSSRAAGPRPRGASTTTLQWHLHDLWPELRLPGSSLFYGKWGPASHVGWRGPSRRCAFASPATNFAALRELTQTINALEPRSPTWSPNSAPAARRARLRPPDRRHADRRDRRRPRFATDAHSPAPPAPPRSPPLRATPTATARPRRQPPAQRRAAPHRHHPRPPRPRNPRLHRPQKAEGKTTREAIRCLKRHLARRFCTSSNRPHRPETALSTSLS